MLEILLAPNAVNHGEYKCGEILYLNTNNYSVACYTCKQQVEFDKFKQHFEDEHLSFLSEDKGLPFKKEKMEILVVNEMGDEIRSELHQTEEVVEEEDEVEVYIEDGTLEDEEEANILCDVYLESHVPKEGDGSEKNKDTYVIEEGEELKIKPKFTKYYCSECSQEFRSSSTLEVHKRKHKNLKDNPKEVEETTQTPYVDEKSIDYDTLEKLQENANSYGTDEGEDGEDWYVEKDEDNNSVEDEEHTTTEDDGSNDDKLRHPIESIKCPECNRYYKSQRSLNVHIQSVHNSDKVKRSQLKFKCDDCGEKFRTQRNLEGHKYKHTGIVCDICGKSFTQAGNMKRHKIRHTGIKAFKCKECDKSFFLEKELNSHMLCHSKSLPVICEVCGRQCRDNYKLNDHMRRHTGERPAKCQECGKCFFSFYDLRVHAVTHTTARPFSCDICGSTFQLKKALRVHKKIHNKDQPKPFICELCGKAFGIENGLAAHIRSHESGTLKHKKGTIR